MATSKRITGKQLFSLITMAVVVCVVALFLLFMQERENASAKTFALGKNTTASFSLPIASANTPAITTFAVVPEPTTNPADPYNPMPLRVGTIGAAIFHRPFCPYAKQSLVNHGLEKRTNYWSREQLAESGRSADSYCLAGIFDCSDVSPTDFVEAGNDPWCGANVSRRNYEASGIDAAIAGKVLCNLQGYIGTFVDEPSHCVNGSIRGSLSTCDQAACSACRADPAQDCTTECTDCVLVTMAALNKVAMGLGDANQDGELDIDDYLYYHECYSGPSTPATMPCLNVFDWDEDGDVDVDDFANFAFSYDSGNESWANTNYPPASNANTVINPDRSPLPLRVGTEGASYYHRLDCPSVNASWNTHGVNKRVDFYNWKHIEDSGRVSDDRTCFAGTRSNPSGSLQDCSLDDDGDESFNCEDECPTNTWKTTPGQCGCGTFDTDSDEDGTANCNDGCPNDPNKIAPGECGCGIAEPAEPEGLCPTGSPLP